MGDERTGDSLGAVFPVPVGGSRVCAVAGMGRRLLANGLEKTRQGLLSCLLPAAVLAGWQTVTAYGLVPEYLLPSPETVWQTGCIYLGLAEESVTGGYAGRFWADLAASLGRVGLGYALAVVPGVFLGLASGRNPWLSRLLSPIVNGIRSVPGISWLPLVLLWFGIGFRATTVLIALAGFFPAYLNAAAGASSVPPILLRAGEMLGLSRTALVFRVIIPAAIPQIRTGLRIALGMSFSYLVLGELTGVPDGLGATIMDARLSGRVDLLLAGIFCIALAGWLCDLLLVRLLSVLSTSLRRQ